MISNESWIRFHAAFELVLDELIAAVAKEKERDPEGYKTSPQTRLLARVYRAITKGIPADPQHPAYHQGDNPEYGYRGWKRALPAEEYRLFFKYLKEENTIVYTWLNSEVTLAKYRSHVEAYHAFRNGRY